MVAGENKNLFGLLGKNIEYSFSRAYFAEKFDELELKNFEYVNFDLQSIEAFTELVEKNKKILNGMNVTIPYKEEVIPFLDEIDEEAEKIGAVNTIKFTDEGTLKGYNTDFYGFKNSIAPLLSDIHKKAFVLGTGGASKAVAFALERLGLEVTFVSRRKVAGKVIQYQDLNQELMEAHLVIVNCTPLGTHPDVEQCPSILYDFITADHVLYDLIYNPAETKFLQQGKNKGAAIKNGLEMLELQAEKSWEIWNHK